MGRSRWRNRNTNANDQRRHAPVTATVKIDSVTPECPGMRREGLDGIVTIALQDLDRLVADMRENLGTVGDLDADSVVKRYLVYLSVLVDVALADIVMSAIHGNDIAVDMKQRMLVEYAAKAEYYETHPDYALYMCTIGEAKSILSKAKLSGYDAETIRSLEDDLEQKQRDFAHVASVQRPKFDQIMHELTERELGRNDEYIGLYCEPSALMHGDPESMRRMFAMDPGAQSLRVRMKLPDAYLNALMVDAGGNALLFCRVFTRRFHPDNKALGERLQNLDLVFKRLVLKHSEGRNPDELAAIRQEVQA